MMINHETLKLAAQQLEQAYPGIQVAVDDLALEDVDPPTKKDVLGTLLVVGAAFNAGNALFKVYQAAQQILAKLDTEGRTDEQILEMLQQQLYKDYLHGMSGNSGTVQAIIRALISAAAKRATAIVEAAIPNSSEPPTASKPTIDSKTVDRTGTPKSRWWPWSALSR
jgi:acetyl/propionyl-CoA carboxylase alpha subunit